MHTPQLLAFLLLTIIWPTLSDPFGDLQVTPTSSTIQEITDYQFSLTLTGDGMSTYNIPVGSSLVIHFPEEYPLLAAQTLTCAIIQWPTPYSPITCSLAYRTLTLTNPFTSPLTIGLSQTYTFKWLVKNIQNPQYATTTSYFSGDITSNGTPLFSSFTPASYLGLTITPGTLSTSPYIQP